MVLRQRVHCFPLFSGRVRRTWLCLRIDVSVIFSQHFCSVLPCILFVILLVPPRLHWSFPAFALVSVHFCHVAIVVSLGIMLRLVRNTFLRVTLSLDVRPWACGGYFVFRGSLVLPVRDYEGVFVAACLHRLIFGARLWIRVLGAVDSSVLLIISCCRVLA